MAKLTLEDLKAITEAGTEDSTKKERLQIERERLELAKRKQEAQEQQARERARQQARKEEARQRAERRAFIVGILASFGALLVVVLFSIYILNNF